VIAATFMVTSLVRDRGWMEFTVYPLFSPQSLIAEGTANFGIEVAFPGRDRVEFERTTLFPAAGLDAARAPEYYEVQALIDQLTYAGNEAARRYLNGGISREEAAAWLERYALSPKDRAAQRVRFFDQYRSYVINYNLGKDMVRSYIESKGGTADRPAERWQFAALLSSPRLPSGLLTMSRSVIAVVAALAASGYVLSSPPAAPICRSEPTVSAITFTFLPGSSITIRRSERRRVTVAAGSSRATPS
jgi:hypothetical protein